MALSAISGITQEDQPLGIASFIRSGTVYVVWWAPFSLTGNKIRWKPHNGLDFTEIIAPLVTNFNNASVLYHPASDRLIAVWDDGQSVDQSRNGNLLIARFHPLTGEVVSGPTVLCPGSNPRLCYYTTTPNSYILLYFRNAKTRAVYGKFSNDGGVTFDSGYPLLTGQVSATTAIEIVPYNNNYLTIAQVGGDTRTLLEVGMLQRTRPLQAIVKHPTLSNKFFVGEPSRLDATTLLDNLRGALVLATDNSKLFHLDGVAQGTSDGVGAVALYTITGTVFSLDASAGPTGNGDDLNSYTLVPTSTTPNVDLPSASIAVGLSVSATHGYVAEYTDNSSVLGQLIVVDLSTGSTGTPLSGIAAVRATGVGMHTATPLIFVATTESSVERLRVYSENALTPTLLLNVKLPARTNAITVTPRPSAPTVGALVYVSMVDRLNVYEYVDASTPVQLLTSITLPGGGSFFQSKLASNGNVVVAAGNAGVLIVDSNGGIRAQLTLSGKTVLPWVQNSVYSANALARPRDTNQFARSRFYFRASVGGTSGAAEPAWTSVGNVLDNTVTWVAVGLTDGVATGIALDESNDRIYCVGSAGGNSGTDGRIWLISATGLI